MLRAAAVFGETCWDAGVAELIGGEAHIGRAREWLAILESREVVTRQPTSRFRDKLAYSFRSALVREAAYAMLTEEDCRLGHELAGHWLEACGDDRATSPLARSASRHPG